MNRNAYPGRVRRAVTGALLTGVVLTGASLAAEQSDYRAQKADAGELADYLRGQFALPEKGAPARATIFLGTIAVDKDGKTVVVYHNPLVTEMPKDVSQLADDTIVVESQGANGSGDVDEVDLPGNGVRVMPEDPQNPYRTLTLRLQAQKGGPGSPMYEMVECTPEGGPLPDPLVLGTIATITSEK